MEPRGCNPWQIGGKSDRRRSRENKPRTVAVGCDRLPERSDGKEGVAGSSPAEGFARFAGTSRGNPLIFGWLRGD